ncbi:hypothetical protein JHK85_035200 [Glycine max]|nr:hypothetical protein JHK85_035200 [Glycine max]
MPLYWVPPAVELLTPHVRALKAKQMNQQTLRVLQSSNHMIRDSKTQVIGSVELVNQIAYYLAKKGSSEVFVSYHAFHLPFSLTFCYLQTLSNSSSFSATHGDVNGGFALVRDSLHGSRSFPPTRTISPITEQFYTDYATNISFYAVVLRSFLGSPNFFVSFAVYARNSNSRISLSRDFPFHS